MTAKGDRAGKRSFLVIRSPVSMIGLTPVASDPKYLNDMTLDTMKNAGAATIEDQELKQHLGWIIKLRWFAVVTALLVAYAVRGLGYLSFSLVPVHGALGFSALYNVFFAWLLRHQQKGLLQTAILQIVLDQLTLGFVLYVSGACLSPFLYFFLFHVVISGILLPPRHTVMIAGLAAGIPGAVIALSHRGILPRYDIFNQDPSRIVDISATLSHGAAFLGTLFLTAFFIIYLNRRLHQSRVELQRNNRKLAALVQVARPNLPQPELEQLLTEALRTVLGDGKLFARLIIPHDGPYSQRCHEFFSCKSYRCPAYNTDAPCWHLSGTLCNGEEIASRECTQHRGCKQHSHSCPSLPSARTGDDKMNSCIRCGYFARVVAAGAETGADFSPPPLSSITEVQQSTVYRAIQNARQTVLDRRRSAPSQTAAAGDPLAFPLRMHDRLSGLLFISSESGIHCTDDMLEFVHLLAEVTAAGLFSTDLFEYLETSFLQTVTAMANAVEAKDPYTRGHSEQVAFYCIQIAVAMGLTKQEKEHLSFAAMLHDVGKIGINIDILGKQDRLVKNEEEDVKAHPLIGARILEPVHFLKPVAAAIKHHHENYDGTGYPEGLKGEEIPLKARIVKVADAWDAMTSDRPYRVALPRSEALKELTLHAGTQFDPEIVTVFIESVVRKNQA